MKLNLAYATLVGTALMASAALAEEAGKAPADQSAQTQAAPSEGQFIKTQDINEWRAPKLIGVDVYGADNQKVGKIKDILLSHDGSAKAVVIEIGGFLGIGAKDVALPFGSVQWKTEPRTAPTADTTAPPATTTSSANNTMGNNTPPPPAKKTDPAVTEATQGYPDKAMINMTLAQVKSAPDFQYAANVMDQTGGSASESANTQRPQPQPTKP